jgi:hypothetical protein
MNVYFEIGNTKQTGFDLFGEDLYASMLFLSLVEEDAAAAAALAESAKRIT